MGDFQVETGVCGYQPSRRQGKCRPWKLLKMNVGPEEAPGTLFSACGHKPVELPEIHVGDED